MGQTIRVPPFALGQEFSWLFALPCLSVLPLKGLESNKAIVITVFPRPIASARI